MHQPAFMERRQHRPDTLAKARVSHFRNICHGHGIETACVVVVSVTAPITGGNKDPLVIMFIAVNQLLKSVVMEDQSVYQSVMNLQTGAVKCNIILWSHGVFCYMNVDIPCWSRSGFEDSSGADQHWTSLAPRNPREKK